MSEDLENVDQPDDGSVTGRRLSRRTMIAGTAGAAAAMWAAPAVTSLTPRAFAQQSPLCDTSDSTQAGARQLVPGITETASLCFQGDTDWWVFTLVGPGNISLQVNFPGSRLNFDLLTAGNVTLASASGVQTATFSFFPLAAGTYYVRLVQTSATGGSYHLLLQEFI